MNIRDYQARTPDTAMYGKGAYALLLRDYPTANDESYSAQYLRLAYCAIKLNGEAGELAEEVGKALRDDGGKFTEDRIHAIVKEAGDVMWYLSQIHNELGIIMEYTLEQNLDKLQARQKANQLHGRGSDR